MIDTAVAESAPDRPTLRGHLVTLRPLGEPDVEPVAEMQREPEVARWWGEPDLAHLAVQAAGNSDEAAFAIEHEGELVGLIQFGEENEPDYRHASIDLFLSARRHRRGLGADAVRTLARHLIDERGHHRITIDPTAANEAAIRCYESVGFKAVGVMRRYWRGPDGRWHDGLLMDLLAEEMPRSE